MHVMLEKKIFDIEVILFEQLFFRFVQGCVAAVVAWLEPSTFCPE
jgi:hypothetical protein